MEEVRPGLVGGEPVLRGVFLGGEGFSLFLYDVHGIHFGKK